MPTPRIKIENIDRLMKKLESRMIHVLKSPKSIVTVGYSAEYAIYVHENLMATHKPPTQAKFLEQPIREMKPALKQEIETLMSTGRMTLAQCLLIIGHKILAASQLLVPVATGALKASGFVKEGE